MHGAVQAHIPKQVQSPKYRLCVWCCYLCIYSNYYVGKQISPAPSLNVLQNNTISLSHKNGPEMAAKYFKGNEKKYK